jgi:hypothetical protein
MVQEAKSWIRDNSTLIYFLIAQFIAIGAFVASGLAYMVKLETRVAIMEERGAAYTVGRMDDMKLRINALEQQIENNERSINRIVDTMTKRLNISP